MTGGTITYDEAIAGNPTRSLGLSRIAARWYETWLRDRHPGVMFSVRVLERERPDDPA